MSNLINQYLKTEATQAMKDIFDSFKRQLPLRFYKMQNEEVMIHDPNYNADFMEMEQAPSITSTAVYKDFYVRVWYLDLQKHDSFLRGGDDLNVKVKQFYNRVRIQMEADAFEYLKSSQRFIIADEKYSIEQSWKRVGILDSFQFYEIVLSRVP